MRAPWVSPEDVQARRQWFPRDFSHRRGCVKLPRSRPLSHPEMNWLERAPILLVAAACAWWSEATRAEPLRAHLSVDLARATAGHQAEEFGLGAGVSGSVESPLTAGLGAELKVSALWLSERAPPSDPSLAAQGSARAVAGGFGLRLLPFGLGDASPGVGSLWLAMGGGVVATGRVLRPTVDARVGYDVRLGRSSVALGPALGFVYVYQPNRELRPDDAQVALFGVHMVFGGAGEAVSMDRDGDGLLDSLDKCPDDPEDFDGYQDEDGCAEADNDGDRLPDVKDECPNEPEDFDGYQDEDGCAEADNDGDRLPDVKDECPNEPEDFDEYQDEDGCAEADNDGDGLPDVKDKCPNEPETVNDYADEDGCPDEADVRVIGDKIILDDRVHFWTNSHLIRRESYPLIARIARLLNAHPEYERIEVEGHADRRGPESFNKPLSERRAEEVMKHLIKNGVDASRLSFIGYGTERPLAEGTSDYDLWLNRRVEFRITRRASPLSQSRDALTPAPAASGQDRDGEASVSDKRGGLP